MFEFAFEKALFAFAAERPQIEPLFAFPPNNHRLTPIYQPGETIPGILASLRWLILSLIVCR